MATRDEGEGLPIGEVLKRTRTRLRIDIRTVEQQTKIRAK
jgi:cytoskeletal protein RodZ